MIELKEIKNDSDLKKFVTFPFKLYKNSKYWIPPIISEEMNNFKSDINPSLKDSSISLFIAIKDNEVVGRIAAIINWIEVKNYKVKKILQNCYIFRNYVLKLISVYLPNQYHS